MNNLKLDNLKLDNLKKLLNAKEFLPILDEGELPDVFVAQLFVFDNYYKGIDLDFSLSSTESQNIFRFGKYFRTQKQVECATEYLGILIRQFAFIKSLLNYHKEKLPVDKREEIVEP